MSTIITRKSKNAQQSADATLRKLRADALFIELQRQRVIYLDADTYRQFTREGFYRKALDLAACDLVEDKRAQFKVSGLTTKLVLVSDDESEAQDDCT